MKGLVLAGLALAGLALAACHARAASAVGGAAPARRPNVILIMVDDVGTEAFRDWGGTSYATPRIDRLAAGGVRFSACHAQPLCTPTRVQIMTGRSNVWNYTRFGILDPGERTFAHMLSAAGYATAVTGKWQLFGNRNDGEHAGTGTHPRDAGFDEYCLWQIDRVGSRYWDPVLERAGEPLRPGPEAYGPDVFCDFALDFMERNAQRPFFLYYPMALVHAPFVPTPASEDHESKDKQANFADMMAHLDAIVGRIVDGVERLGLREDTLILFTSDNGTDRPIVSETVSGPVRGGKNRTLDTGTHVPLIAYWPDTAPAGRVCADLVDTTDFLPTLASVAGVEPPGPCDGISFAPQIEGAAGSPREWIYCYYNPRPGGKRFPERRFARDERFKVYADGTLFDLATDPLERQPLGPGVFTAARSRLQSVLESFPSTGQRLRPNQEK